MLEIGLSSCNAVIDDALLSRFAAGGIKHIEVSTTTMELADALDWSNIKDCSVRCGVGLWSFHLPFSPFRVIDVSNPALADFTVEYFSSLIEKAASVGVKRFIIHPSAEPIADEDRPARIACAKKSLSRLADLADKFGGVICVEDLPRTCLGRNSAELMDIVSAHPSLRVCFDTNHMLSESLVDFIKNTAEKIETTHVSDYDFLNERHWLPGEGKIDWKSLYETLIGVGYKGTWLYELRFEQTPNISRPRDLTCEDFYKNANEIFSGSPITVIGTPQGELKAWNA